MPDAMSARGKDRFEVRCSVGSGHVALITGLALLTLAVIAGLWFHSFRGMPDGPVSAKPALGTSFYDAAVVSPQGDQPAEPDGARAPARLPGITLADTPHAPDPGAPGFRLCALTGTGNEAISAGVEEAADGHAYLLRVGEHTASGWTFLHGDMDAETAVFAKDGHEYTLEMQRGSRRLEAVSVEDGGAVTERASNQQHRQIPGSGTVFLDRTIEMDSLGPVTIKLDQENTDWVRVKADRSDFMLRREMADAILRVERLGEQDRVWMLLSHPALVKVMPAEDAVRVAQEAETELNEILNNPPTNSPSTEELDKLIEQVQP
jgi:hypothetical protein